MKKKHQISLMTSTPIAEQQIARISAVHKERYSLIFEKGEGFGRLKASAYYHGQEDFPTTGDYVEISSNPHGDSQILSTLPRRTYFSRKNPDLGRGEQAVAANFDYVFILQSVNQDFNEKRLERYLTLAWQSGAIPVVLLTKSDLTQEHQQYLNKAQSVALGVSIHLLSSVTGQGISELGDYLKPGKTVVLLGSSGVGKSSLVNALLGEEIMATKSIRHEDSKGKHTTTHRQLLVLGNGSMIIDTPGMRELGMWDVTSGLNEAFHDVEALLGKCKFHDCKHQSEPGCAIKEALHCGTLDPKRWKSYCKLQREAELAQRKDLLMKQKKQKATTNLLKKRRDKAKMK